MCGARTSGNLDCSDVTTLRVTRVEYGSPMHQRAFVVTVIFG
jgi:hypothetical protein